jgi:hypothetical protein
VNAHDFALLVAFVLVAILAVGCGNEALRINAGVARAMLEVQAESGPVIRELRVSAGVEAGREAHARGEPEATAQAAASSAAARWSCAIDGHRLYSLAVGAYIDTLALWVAGRDFELVDAIPFVRRALDSYRVLSSCLRSLGSEVLPEAPSFLDMIPPTWSTE